MAWNWTERPRTVKAKKVPIGQVIKEAREDLTQDELAHRAGLAQPQISRWERGEASPSLDEVEQIEIALGLPRGFLLKAAGYAQDTTTTEDAIRTDPALKPDYRRFIVEVYRTAVRDSRAGGKRR